MHPQVRFLDAKTPLAEQIASYIDSVSEDWLNTEIWVPTAGAERAIRLALAKICDLDRNRPSFCQPMEALLRQSGEKKIANRSEREVAWFRALCILEETDREALFPAEFDFDDASRMLGFAGAICDLEDLLAEGLLWPGDARIAKVCEQDAERWLALAKVSRSARQLLKEAGLADPNELRFRSLEGNTKAPRHLFIAAIPDLPLAAELLAGKWILDGTSVTVMVWLPAAMPAGFDAWGRPEVDRWNAAVLSVADDQIHVFPNSGAEAAAAVEYLKAKGQEAGVVVPDSALVPAIEAAAYNLGMEVFSPGGKSLALSEPGRLAMLWSNWQVGGSFAALRHLLELPSFAAWVSGKLGELWNYRRILLTLEFLSVNCLAGDLISADLVLREKDIGFHTEEINLRQAARELIAFLQGTKTLTIPEILRSIFPDAEEDSPPAIILELITQFETSSLLRVDTASDVTSTIRSVLRRALAREKTYPPAPENACVLNGWLEAPWLDAPSVYIVGCQDSVLPGIKRGHAFLPDAARTELGLVTQASRRARDAYLLEALCKSRNPDDFFCSFSQKETDGSVSLPSSLLLRCAAEELPKRIKRIFSSVEGPVRPRRETGWKWELPQAWRKEAPCKISPTDFSQYLRCPLRYYFGRVLGAEAFDHDAREMDARQFGTLVHDALEYFAKQHPDLESEDEILNCLVQTFEERARRMFGARPAGAVLVQMEAIRVRLRAFARLQAQQRRDGWKIIAAERKLSVDDPNPFIIGGLPLSAKVDRIDLHEDGTLRILDYKTSASPKKPTDTHFATGGRSSHVVTAQVCVDGKEKTWADLQLPLYRMIAERWYPECKNFEVAYGILPADPAHTVLSCLPLGDELLSSARDCAHEVAEHVRLGHFWPPQPWPAGWDDPLAAILVNRPAADSFSSETIEFLKGKI